MKNLPLLSLLLLNFLGLSGQTGFTEQETGMTGTIRGLHVFSNRVVWVSGSKGEFSVTKNGGRTWYHDTVPGCSSLDFRDVEGFSSKRGLLMSAGTGGASRIYRTENGGKSWALVYQNTDEKAFFDGMDFFDDQHGLIIGDPVDVKPYLLETRDGGLIWTRLNPERIPDLLPGEYAFAASGTSLDARPDGSCSFVTGGSVSRVFCSADRGKTWEAVVLPFLHGDPAAGAFSVARGSGKHIAAAGGNYQKMTLSGLNIALSDDNGQTWTVPPGADPVPFMECIRWINATALVACGPPGFWMSADTGRNWEEMSREGFHVLEVTPDKSTIWLAGNRGRVVKWR